MALRSPFTSREPKVDPKRADMQIESPPTYAVPAMGSYSAPTLEEGSPYNDEFGWGPKLRTSAQEIPSAQRLQQIPRRDMRPNPVRPPEEWYDTRDADTAKRHSVETVDADGWTELKGQKRWAPNPRSIPVPESRPTQQMAPRSYSFTRPFDQHAAREFNGTHFSMADHRRNYEILGMSPVRTMRNTYRIEPIPWDGNIVDLPPEESFLPEARLRGVELQAPNRSRRL
jgi:hypothetical protein